MYWVNNSGEAKGPYTFEQLRSMWGNGLLTADMSYYDSDGSDWKLLRFLLEKEDLSLRREVAKPIQSNDGGLLSYLFTPRGRIGRLETLVMGLLYLLIAGVLLSGLEAISKQSPLYVLADGLGVGVIMIAWAWLTLSLVGKRLHDLNQSAWLSILSLFPFINLCMWISLVIISGKKSKNRFGDRIDWILFPS